MYQIFLTQIPLQSSDRLEFDFLRFFDQKRSKTRNAHIFVIADIQGFTSQILGVAGPLGENVDISSLLGFDVQTNSYHKTHKIKTQSVRALKRYLNKKNVIQGRVVATISEFIPKSFETYF